MRENKKLLGISVAAGFIACVLLIVGIYNSILLLDSLSSSEAVVIESRTPPRIEQEPVFDNVASSSANEKKNSNENEPPANVKLVGRGTAEIKKMMALLNFSLKNLTIDQDDISSGGPGIDDIPALTDPARIPVASIQNLAEESRIIVVDINDEVVAYPIQILNHHEIINDVVGDVPIAVTFCPLCDSAMVCDRRIETVNDDNVALVKTLEFGVSGLLCNSNILLYDRTDYALWSQLLMEAVSGPHAGTPLKVLSFRMMELSDVKSIYPEAEVVSLNTGHKRNYQNNPYSEFLNKDTLMFTPRSMGTELPTKTAGIGILDGERSIFVTRSAFDTDSKIIVTTSEGDVLLCVNDAGFSVKNKPEGIRAVQTFYYAWSAYYPETELLTGN